MSARRAKADPHFHVVLLAGGSGTRFWPMSRNARPKQFLSLAGSEPLLRTTWRRVRLLAPPSRIWVVAPAYLAAQVRETLPGLKEERLVIEPSPRDTAPAIGLACAKVARVDRRATVGVFPTDHVVRDAEAFAASVRRAAAVAGEGKLVCLGIVPDRPETGFGYLKCAHPPGGRPVDVERFVEKPDEARAHRFVRSGRYLWNAGMFVWKVERFLEELKRTSPRTARAVSAFAAGDPRAWARSERLSVDYAVMEQAERVAVVPLEAGWDDIGSWEAAARLADARPGSGRNTLLIDSPGATVFGGSRLVAVVGVDDVVVVDTDDALLVLAKSQAQEVKEIVKQLRARRRGDLI